MPTGSGTTDVLSGATFPPFPPRVGWTLTDPVSHVTYDFAINPDMGGANAELPFAKNLVANWGPNVLSKTGAVIEFDQDLPMQGSFEGHLLNTDQYDQFTNWWLVDHPVILTDDLGREYEIYITEFQPQRTRKADNVYFQTYTVRFYVLDYVF